LKKLKISQCCDLVADASLQEEGYEVICFTADIGQEEDFDAVREKALQIGASKVYIEDIRREVGNSDHPHEKDFSLLLPC
jgi:hypothetical protein